MLLVCAVAAPPAACGDRQTEEASAAVVRTASDPAGSTPAAQEGVLGTLRVSLDGQERTWYIVRGEGGTGPYSSGMWMEGSDDGVIVSLSGLDSDSPPIHTFEADFDAGEMSLGEYRGSSFSLTVPVKAEEGARRFTLPADDNSGASIVYTSDAAAIVDGIDMTNLFTLVEGEIQIAAVERIGGSISIRGTFSGTLESMEGGRRIAAAEGRFAAETIPSLQSMKAERSP